MSSLRDLDPNAKVGLAILVAMGGVVAGYRLRGATSQVLMVAGLALAQWLSSSAQEDARREEGSLPSHASRAALRR